MDYTAYLRFILAFGLVMGLIILCAYLARRLGFGGRLGGLRNRRLQIIETTAIDAKNRLVLVRRDQVEHLLALSPGGTVVVESRITDSKPDGLVAPPPSKPLAKSRGSSLKPK
ncbi:MAG: flagellar biosynthetic protein FliO [Alphaproteobacteria bacterium]|nr:flagellar biosynthetic protein FliO [Alphaproteobacteria bacterium]